METSKERLKEVIEALSKINSMGGPGISRFTYSDDDLKARKYLLDICNQIGLQVRVDAVGNVFARFEGRDPSLPPILTGSHIDSVKSGGAFDGIVGTVGALECVRVMKENNYIPKCPIEVVFFSEEEGSNFKVPVMGSKVLVGKLGIDDLKCIFNSDGISSYDMAKNAGFNPDNIPNDVLKKGDIKAMIELHIEQSVRLDMEHHTIGIIQGIAGLKWYKVSFKGKQNHAGATPMNLRQDPMCAAAECIAKVKHIARSINDTAVATVGQIEVIPNIPNAIPAEVSFSVDVRDISKAGIEGIVEKLLMTASVAAQENGCCYTADCTATSEVIEIKPYMVETMEVIAKEHKFDYILMPSGAVHDSNYMAEITDVGMIFVPSIDGRSHVPEERTKFEHIKVGADLLLYTLMKLSS
ncbi:MAG: M20 family metallo-hydrolase [Ruminiclostridium sp.]